MKILAVFSLLLLLQAPAAAQPPAPPSSLPSTLRQLRERLSENRQTFGAAPELTTAKHQLRDWVEARLSALDAAGDVTAFAATLHTALGNAGLLCNDLSEECDWNFLGYLDDVRVSRSGDRLAIVTATGIYCGFDESAYVYARDGQRWRRVWEHERNSYTPQEYLPQIIHDVQISPPDAGNNRLIMTLGSQTICGGAFKDVYARVWRVDAEERSTRVLDWAAHVNDAYPPILGRVHPDRVLLQYTAGGLMSGEVHTAVRQFRIDQGTATQVDPVASLPRDFVVEWLSTPWADVRSRTDPAALESAHAQLHRKDGVGDFPEATLRCTAAPDLWQVSTHLYEGPKRFYRVRWQEPYTFTLVGISETPYPDCTVADARADAYPNLLGRDR